MGQAWARGNAGLITVERLRGNEAQTRRKWSRVETTSFLKEIQFETVKGFSNVFLRQRRKIFETRNEKTKEFVGFRPLV